MKLDVCINDNGTFSFNLFEALSELTDEEKTYLIEDGGYWSFIEEELAKSIVHEFSREHYNSIYTKLREILLTSENTNEMIREWAIANIEEKIHAKEAEKYWNSAYWELYHYVHKWDGEHPHYGVADKMPQLPSHMYGKRVSEDILQDVLKQISEAKGLFKENQ